MLLFFNRGSTVTIDLEDEVDMSKEIASIFFSDCENGDGWESCKKHCTPDASFSCQATPLDDVHTLEVLLRLDERNLCPSSECGV